MGDKYNIGNSRVRNNLFFYYLFIKVMYWYFLVEHNSTTWSAESVPLEQIIKECCPTSSA